MALKHLGEMGQIVKTRLLGNFNNTQIALMEQLLGVLHADIGDVLLGRLGHFQLKCPDKMGRVHVADGRQLIGGEIALEILIDVGEDIAQVFILFIHDIHLLFTGKDQIFGNQIQNDGLYPQPIRQSVTLREGNKLLKQLLHLGSVLRVHAVLDIVGEKQVVGGIDVEMHPILLHGLVREVMVLVADTGGNEKPGAGLGSIVLPVNGNGKGSLGGIVEFVLAEGMVTLVPPLPSQLGREVAAGAVNCVDIQIIDIL